MLCILLRAQKYIGKSYNPPNLLSHQISIFFLAFKWKPCVSFIYKIKQKNLQIKMTQGRDGGGPMILRRSWFLTG